MMKARRFGTQCEQQCGVKLRGSRQGYGRRGHRRSRQNTRGFTLLEVMISMAIVAVTASSLSLALSGMVTSMARLEEKTMAHILGMNKMSELMAQTDWPPLGKRDEFVDMSRREWVVTSEVKASLLPKVRQIEVRIALRAEGISEDAVTIHTLRTLVSQHYPTGLNSNNN